MKTASPHFNWPARLCFCLFLVPTMTQAFRTLAAETSMSPQEVFERRILPIFKSPNPSSCTECHLAGVDLKNWTASLGDGEFVGETVIESEWPKGYGRMTMLEASQLRP